MKKEERRKKKEERRKKNEEKKKEREKEKRNTRFFYKKHFGPFVLKMFLRFQRIALYVSYGFRQYNPLFLIEVFLIKKACKNKKTPITD